MRLIVQKYGGTSVANAHRIRLVAERIRRSRKKGDRVVIVVSALANATNNLLALSKEVAGSPSRREMDALLSTGEQVSTSLLAMALNDLGVRAISLTGFQVGITTDSSHTRARLVGVESKRIFTELDLGNIVIVAGFQGLDAQGNITTLGRGGSDLTAVALAKIIHADVCEIYTDVEGVFTTDPRIEPRAKKINEISYEEMLELASAGAQVMQARSIEFAGKNNVPIHVRSSFTWNKGTWIIQGDHKMEEVLVRGVTLNKKEAKITLANVPDKPGIAGKIFRKLANSGVNIDMIIQNVGLRKKQRTDISFTVAADDVDDAIEAITKVRPEISRSDISANKDIAKISVVGIGMRSHSGVAADMFEVLGRNKINIHMITTSEIKISCVVDKKHGDHAVRLLHQHFIG